MGRFTGRAVLASGNPGKLREMRAVLAAVGVELIPQAQLGVTGAEETGAGFIDNALLKARHAAAASGLPALADDSGLAVDALDGAPGVRSARYAGAEASDARNLEKLLEAMRAVPAGRRAARFHCALVWVRSAEDPVPVVAEGQWRGTLLEAPVGANGFGYDPVFFDAEAGVSAAQMSAEEKRRRSHRGQAMRRLLARLREEDT